MVMFYSSVLTVIIAIFITVGLGSENAISFWNDQANESLSLGDLERAEQCWKNAIYYWSIGQPYAPIIGEIGYSGYCSYLNNNTTINSGPIIDFDIINPNELYLRINYIYIKVLNYSRISDDTFGMCISAIGDDRNYHCLINKKLGIYKCRLSSKDHDSIRLEPNKDPEHLVIEIESTYDGIYQLDILLGYEVVGKGKNNFSVLREKLIVAPLS
jgi:hypothetical protein